jgi:hypothetical protein
MGISLAKAQLISLALSTFLYGASRPTSSVHLTYEPMDRGVFHFVSHHGRDYVLECDGRYSSTALKDTSCVLLDASGGHHGTIESRVLTHSFNSIPL